MSTSDKQNAEFLHLVLTHKGKPNLDFAAISKTLNLSVGATQKRWSRLNKAIEAGTSAGPNAFELLHLAIKFSPREKGMYDWKEIAERCGTTSGAANKRYSRMRLAWEAEGANAINAGSNSTPEKPGRDEDDNDEPSTPAAPAVTTPKRKRGTPAAAASSLKKKTPIKAEYSDASDMEYTPTKKLRGTPKTKVAALSSSKKEKAPIIKAEDSEVSDMDYTPTKIPRGTADITMTTPPPSKCTWTKTTPMRIAGNGKALNPAFSTKYAIEGGSSSLSEVPVPGFKNIVPSPTISTDIEGPNYAHMHQFLGDQAARNKHGLHEGSDEWTEEEVKQAEVAQERVSEWLEVTVPDPEYA